MFTFLYKYKLMREDTTEKLILQGTHTTSDQHTKTSMSVTIQCIKRTDNMSSLSPSKDSRRKSPRKTAGEMPQYLAREYKEHKRSQGGKKLGCDGKKWARETGVKVGLTEKPLIFLSSLSSSDDDSYTSVKVPMKKSRGKKSRPTSGRGESNKVSRVAKGVKVNKVKAGAKGKNTLNDDSDDFSSSDASTPKATIIKSRSASVGEHSVKELLKKIKEKDKKIRSLELELSKSNLTSKMNKRKVRGELKWTG
jgi:hypothetical protein